MSRPGGSGPLPSPRFGREGGRAGIEPATPPLRNHGSAAERRASASFYPPLGGGIQIQTVSLLEAGNQLHAVRTGGSSSNTFISRGSRRSVTHSRP